MPAKVKKVGNKYRVVEADTGKLVTRGGSAVDGGGHKTRAAAQRQASAINIPKGQKKKK